MAEFCFPPSVLLNIVFWTICEYDFVPLISPSAHLAGQQRLRPLPNDPPTLFPIHTPRLNLVLLPCLDTNTAPTPLLPTTPPLCKIWHLNVRWAFLFSFFFFLDSSGPGSSRTWGQRHWGFVILWSRSRHWAWVSSSLSGVYRCTTKIPVSKSASHWCALFY